jgi:beta-phosphoglucomutase-like phosphatase (HAD superfamily)
MEFPWPWRPEAEELTTSTKTKPEHLKDFFAYFEDKVICGDDPPPMKRKSEPDIFLRTAREILGLNIGNSREPNSDAEREVREQVLVFEDSYAGSQKGWHVWCATAAQGDLLYIHENWELLSHVHVMALKSEGQ